MAVVSVVSSSAAACSAAGALHRRSRAVGASRSFEMRRLPTRSRSRRDVLADASFSADALSASADSKRSSVAVSSSSSVSSAAMESARVGKTEQASSSTSDLRSNISELATPPRPAAAAAAAPQAPSPVSAPAFSPILMQDIQAVVLAGGADENNPLTKHRARPALNFGATYRLIDFPLSNCINSKVRRVNVLTQFNSYSLIQHIHRAYPPEVFGMCGTGWVDVLSSNQTPGETGWSVGSADAVRRHMVTGAMSPSGTSPPDGYLILSGEALYRMDYRELLATHNDSAADITIATVRRRAGDATRLGICAVGAENSAVYGFKEKPTNAELREMSLGEDGRPLEECEVTANMGVYIFSARAMETLLHGKDKGAEGKALDFGGNIIPEALRQGFKVHSHAFEGYWQPIRTLREWFDANLEATITSSASGVPGAASLIDYTNPIFTIPRCLPPARFNGEIFTEQSIISEGVVVGPGVSVVNSIVGPCMVLGEGCSLERTILLGQADMALLHGAAAPDVGPGSVLKNCVVDSDVLIGANCIITNAAGVQELDASDRGYFISQGIVTLLSGSRFPPGTVI